MRWADLDGDWWTIPAEHSKNGTPHRVPITPVMKRVLDAQPKGGTTVFASGGHRLKKTGARLSRALGFSFRSHDLRRTVATRLGAAGVSRDAIAAVLGHTQSGPAVTAVYDRYNRDAEKKRALGKWDRLLKQVLDDDPATKVVPFTR
jgi:integrase